MTLIEVLVTLVVLALLTSVATLAPRARVPRSNTLHAMLDDSIAAAIEQGRQITIETRVDGRDVAATIQPSGRVVADSAFRVGTNAR